MRSKFKICILLLAVILLLDGCALLTLDELYCPPKRPEENDNLQSVIDEAPREFLEQPMISRFLQTARENMEKHGMADAVCGE